MQKSSPCKGCPDRDAGCHGRCELYLEWQDEHKRYMKAYRDSKSADYLANAYAKETHARIRRAKEGKKRC